MFLTLQQDKIVKFLSPIVEDYKRKKDRLRDRLARSPSLDKDHLMPTPSYTQDLLDQIRELPEDKIAEVADFVQFLRFKTDERRLAHAATKLSEQAFQKVWDNPDDAEYDQL